MLLGILAGTATDPATERLACPIIVRGSA
ncbi:hypothetical protein [Sphingomonas aliaeris]